MHINPMLHVLTQDIRLGRALVDLCRDLEGLTIGGISRIDAFAPARNALVLTPTTECTTIRCEQLSMGGSRVILLAPVPRDYERLAYIGAGAHAYLPMELRSPALVTTVQEASLALRSISCGRCSAPAAS
jgi:hypothetical protein